MATKNAKLFTLTLAFFAAITGLLFGYDTGVIAGAILFMKKTFRLTIYQQQLIVSIMLLAAGIAALCSGWITDKYGRRKTMIMGTILFIAGALFLTFAQDYAEILIGRVIIGLAVGVSMTAAPMYIAEIAPPRLRGGMVTANQLFVTIGILLAFIMNYAFGSTPNGWRWMFGISCIPAAAQLIALLYFPETPRFLASKGKHAQALKVLQSIRPAQSATKEMAKIKSNLKQQKSSWKELLHAQVFPAFVLSIALHSLQQLTGINAVIYYAPQIFLKAGLSSASAAIVATIGIGIVNVIMTIVAIPLLDRWGRRPLLLTGLGGMIFSLLAIGFTFLSGAPGLTIALLAMIALMAFVGFFAISMGPMPWLMPNEMLPTKLRGRAVSVAIFTNWFFNFVVSGTFLTLVHFLGMTWTFCIYGIVGIASWIFFYTYVPETRNKALEDISVTFRKHKL